LVQYGICMKKIVAESFKRPITKEQSKDTGMAMVLLLLLASAAFKRQTLITAAMIALVVDMTFPQLYRPVAVLWLGLSHLFGTVVSKIFLTLVFFGVVTPIGLARKLLGIDSLKLKDFKSGENSVMVIRNHIFTGKDIEKPY
jgi:ABC-type enterochelin transport system permease subunit